MNEKAGFEILLKECKHETCTTVRTIAWQLIKNWVNKYLLHYSLFLRFSQVIYINY